MIYKKFQDLELSQLGFGTMRLPLLEDGITIDEQRVAEMTAYAIAHGVDRRDQFDTQSIGIIIQRFQFRIGIPAAHLAEVRLLRNLEIILHIEHTHAVTHHGLLPQQ